MKVTLKKDHSIRGVIEKAETVVDIGEGVALDLIKRGIASKPGDKKPKAGK